MEKNRCSSCFINFNVHLSSSFFQAGFFYLPVLASAGEVPEWRDEDALQFPAEHLHHLCLELDQCFYKTPNINARQQFYCLLLAQRISGQTIHRSHHPERLISDIMANMCTYGSFTHAVVRGIPETFGKVVEDGQANGEVSVDLAKAQRQFGCLAGALRQKVGLQLIEIPSDPELPESWRIEDVAVIQGGTALITKPFKQQRRSEVTHTHTEEPVLVYSDLSYSRCNTWV